MKLAGIPEGVQVVRIGIAGPEDFEILNDPTNQDPPFFVKGPRAGSNAQVIVRPAAGWEFREHFEIRAYEKRWELAKVGTVGPVVPSALPAPVSATGPEATPAPTPAPAPIPAREVGAPVEPAQWWRPQ